MRTEKIRIASVAVLSAIVVIAGVVIARQAARVRDFERQHAQDVASLDRLRSELSRRPQPGAAPAAAPGVARLPHATPEDSAKDSELAARDAMIESLRRAVDDANAATAAVQGKLEESERLRVSASATAVAQAKQDREQDRQVLSDLQRQLNEARAAADEAQDFRNRIAALEKENGRLRDEGAASSQRLAELSKATDKLRDLDRRRDVYLTSILRRYREITDQFRAVGGAMEGNRSSGPDSFRGVALSRIQDATSQAEEDLRRLNELSSQARQLQTRLGRN